MIEKLQDCERARGWLHEHCHQAEVRRTLARGIEYLEAIERAGICPDHTCGDDLYDFLTDPANTAARAEAFVSPTL